MAKLTEGSGHPENVVVLADGANDEAFSQLSFTDTANLGKQETVVSLGSEVTLAEGDRLEVWLALAR